MDLEKEAEWQEIQQQLDRDYKNKMKLVNDEAMKKLQDYSMEHQETIVRMQNLYKERSNSRA